MKWDVRRARVNMQRNDNSLFLPLFLLNVSQGDRRLMWPVIHGHGEHIPIHLSFPARELVNRPENMSKDIHIASEALIISLIHNEYLPRFTAFILVVPQSRFHTIRALTLSHCQLCIS